MLIVCEFLYNTLSYITFEFDYTTVVQVRLVVILEIVFRLKNVKSSDLL